MSKIGHNSEVNHDQLRSIIERVERLEEEKRVLADDIKDVYAEARGNGFDPKILRKVVARRRMDRDKLAEEETMLDVYLRALGDFVNLPLGAAAIERVR